MDLTFDPAAILAILKAIDPKAAVIGAVVLFLIQRARSGDKSGLLTDLLAKLFPNLSKPSVPGPQPGPTPAPRPAPDAPSAPQLPDEADGLLDILLERIREKLKDRIRRGDAGDVVGEYTAIARYLDRPASEAAGSAQKATK